MQTFKIDINDNIVDKILWFLNNFDGVKVEKFDKKSKFLDDMEESERDILNGRVTEIGDIDEYIKDLKNEIN